MAAVPDLTVHFHPVLRASRLRRGPVQVKIGGVAYALYRDRDGIPRALADRCPHRHAPLSRGRVRDDGRLACRYHGWHFGADGDGRSPAIPSLRCQAAAFQLIEDHGFLWLARPDVERARLPVLDAPDHRFIGALSMAAPAPVHVVFDNFSEDEHTPTIHGRLGWREEDSHLVDLEVRCLDDRTEVVYTAPQRPSRLLPLMGVRSGDTFRNEWVTRFSPLHTVYDIEWSDPSSGARRPFSLRVTIFFVPETERTTQIVAFLFARPGGRVAWPLRVAFERAALAMTWKEIWDDARWVRHIADTQVGFEGMRLTRFDKPLAHNRKLMESLYYGAAAQPRLVTLASGRERPT